MIIKKNIIDTAKAFPPSPLRGYGETGPLSNPPKSLSCGFTLIEVLMAMGILTTTIFIIANLQSRSLNKILFDRDRLEHLFLIKREYYANFIKPPHDGKKIINTLEDPKDTENNVKFVTTTHNINDKSQLKDLKKYIKVMGTTATWKIDSDKRELSMISLVYTPVKKEKEKK